MNHFNPIPEVAARILATDLDGTLIPLPDEPANRAALQAIRSAHNGGELPLIFATGRHFESVLEAIETYRLPEPEWIICDVGSRIVRRCKGAYLPFAPYEAHLEAIVGGHDRREIEALLQGLDGLDFQISDHQTDHKISYQCAAGQVEALTLSVRGRLAEAGAPYSAMGSLDPFLNIGLIDVLPGEVNKAYALHWLATHADFSPHGLVYAGDSGNDEAALSAGFRAIIVANASTGLASRVRATLAQRGLEDRLFCANLRATSGVLEGLHYFKLTEATR